MGHTIWSNCFPEIWKVSNMRQTFAQDHRGPESVRTSFFWCKCILMARGTQDFVFWLCYCDGGCYHLSLVSNRMKGCIIYKPLMISSTFLSHFLDFLLCTECRARLKKQRKDPPFLITGELHCPAKFVCLSGGPIRWVEWQKTFKKILNSDVKMRESLFICGKMGCWSKAGHFATRRDGCGGWNSDGPGRGHVEKHACVGGEPNPHAGSGQLSFAYTTLLKIPHHERNLTSCPQAQHWRVLCGRVRFSLIYFWFSFKKLCILIFH